MLGGGQLGTRQRGGAREAAHRFGPFPQSSASVLGPNSKKVGLKKNRYNLECTTSDL